MSFQIGFESLCHCFLKTNFYKSIHFMPFKATKIVFPFFFASVPRTYSRTFSFEFYFYWYFVSLHGVISKEKKKVRDPFQNVQLIEIPKYDESDACGENEKKKNEIPMDASLFTDLRCVIPNTE